VSASSGGLVVLVRAGARICALDVRQVIETMRPLPVAPLPGMPPFVRGAAVIRGSAVPVVDLDAFLGPSAGAASRRLVLVRCGARAAALAVDEVLGVTALDPSRVTSQPLLDAGAGGAIEAIGALDRELLVVLQGARVVPPEAWQAISEREVAR
jgi:purine-binding chemotaxis protein CheW